MLGESLLRKNLVPDFVIRNQIRKLLKIRLRELDALPGDSEAKFAASLRNAPIAVETQSANQQHYEVPSRFFELVLGPQLKYSCALFEHPLTDLPAAEEAMLTLTAQRAELRDGQEILELGCGWGSLSLWMAKNHPRSRITAISNSRSQKEFIDARAAARGIRNLSVITQDMNDFNPTRVYDRVVSIEMFEHMRNVPALFTRVANSLNPEGKAFIHVFTHARSAYLFEARDNSDWMARHFFTGGMMPSDSLYARFAEDLRVQNQWTVDGRHYQRTAEAWLANMDRARAEIMPLFTVTYGRGEEKKWWAYWRVFFMSCSELWGYGDGREWHVMHYLFSKGRAP